MASSRRKVLVTLNFFALSGYGFTLTAGEMQRAKETLVDQVRSLWNHRRLRLILFVLDERGRPTGVSRSLDVEFRIRWTRSMASADYVLCVYPTQNDVPMVPGRTDRPPFVMSGAFTQPHRIEMHIAATEPAWTFSHEFGHCIGLPDEYSSPASAISSRTGARACCSSGRTPSSPPTGKAASRQAAAIRISGRR
jgi:hypothetical protein